MKTILSLIFTFIFLCSFNLKRVTGQAVATGHVTAEVINDVSASSIAVTDLNLKKKDLNAGFSQSSQTSLNQGKLNLGLIQINSGKGTVCDVIIQPAKLTDTKGDVFIIEPSINSNNQPNLLSTDNGQTLQISGRACLLSKQPSGQYHGTYTIVLAFN